MRLHEGEPTLAAGAPLAGARAVVVAVHGRGADAAGILSLAVEAFAEDGVAFLAPQARHGTWYPRSFLAPFSDNEPWLSSALARLRAVADEVAAAGVAADHVLWFGFSQGACLASEFVARHSRRWGGLVAAVGARIGPPGARFDPVAGFAGTPVHLAAGDPDPHVPWERVEESAAFFRASGAAVELARLPGFPHAVPPSSLGLARRIIGELAQDRV